ncbi:MAG: rhodoquinone biosynthesis methyltransferase RquA [Anaerolineales bacterium]|nr:rhodoquinone biosynthesis methyltransferase RquA [Anaerolineales bacterium]
MNNTTSQASKQSRLIGSAIDSRAIQQKNKPEWSLPIPAYLEQVYWWAYVRPYAVAFFDREWIVNLILLGNMVKLRDLALDALGQSIPGRTLQIACVYGDFSLKLAQRIARGGSLDIVDAAPAQLENARLKLLPYPSARVLQSDSANLRFANATYDQIVMFFLLHEMPKEVRDKTLSEALRVLKPGGELVIVDFHKPSRFNPLRYLYPFMFKLLEPFALDIWNHRIEEWLPKDFVPAEITKETTFGGLYQKVVIRA